MIFSSVSTFSQMFASYPNYQTKPAGIPEGGFSWMLSPPLDFFILFHFGFWDRVSSSPQTGPAHPVQEFPELWSSCLPSAVWLVGILSLCFCVQFWCPFLLKVTTLLVCWRCMLWAYLSLTGVVHSGFTPGSVPPTGSDVHTVHLWQCEGPQALGVTFYVCLCRWVKRGTSGPGTRYFV